MWDVLCPQKKDLLNMKRSQLLCWNGFNRRKPPILLKRHRFRRRSSSVKVSNTLGCWVFARGSVLVLMSESLFSIKKQKKNKEIITKWVCMWVLHAIVLICTGVPKKTFVARSPILKKTSSPAALTRYHQPHPKRLYNLIQAHVRGDLRGRRGWEGPGFLPLLLFFNDICRHYVSGG